MKNTELEKLLKGAKPLLDMISGAVKEDFDSYGMWMAYEVSQRSKCFSRKCGAVVTKGKYIISTGYNGPTAGFPHPEGCRRKDLGVPSGEKLEICPCSDAELNAVSQAAQNGIATKGSTLYIFGGILPCTLKCAPAIIGAGIERVVCLFNREHQSNPLAVTTEAKFKYAAVKVEEYNGSLREILIKLESESCLPTKNLAKIDACAGNGGKSECKKED